MPEEWESYSIRRANEVEVTTVRHVTHVPTARRRSRTA